MLLVLIFSVVVVPIIFVITRKSFNICVFLALCRCFLVIRINSGTDVRHRYVQNVSSRNWSDLLV
jgi:TRAP-type mannitol/chloroaromatic compound transport system permease small subunit